ncbi:MAG: M23 family metallopeptidase [Bacteroidales bacterium]|nr:M23 family metallopeptidase [Bacteroidales bacterium]
MRQDYFLDKNDIKVKKKRTSPWIILRKTLVFILATMSVAVIYYIIFALIFSTGEEQKLKNENRLYSQEYPELARKEALLSDVIEGLQLKDDRIYEEIFKTAAPNVDPMESVDFLSGLDTLPDMDLVKYTDRKLGKLSEVGSRVDENFEAIMKAVTDSGFVMPPMHNPLKDFSFAQTGASVGYKINPFYKVEIQHNGLDMIASSGVPVYASADGVVSNVTRSRKGLGNVVEIDHGNGYKTRYAHLSDVVAVKGRKVKRGTHIGNVGMSGSSFAPHLHYEVVRDTVALDPVNHLFATVTPEEYMNILVMSITTGQSMD